MAVPDSLQAWDEFIKRSDPAQPERLTIKRLLALSPEEKERYDAERIAWLDSDIVLRTADIAALDHLSKLAIHRNVAPSATAKRGIAVSGQPTLGKSTAVLHLAKFHEREMRKRRPILPNFQPVVYVVVPASTTPKGLMMAFAHFLGLQIPKRATTQDITETIVVLLKELQTTMVVLDEVHNLRTNRTMGAEAASSLKVFSERIDATFVYVGIDLPNTDLFSGDIGRQIKGRVQVHEMAPYGFGTHAQRQDWTELVSEWEKLLVLARHEMGNLQKLDGYLYDRTGGSIGSLRSLLADAAASAVLNGTERITRSLLDGLTTDRQAEEFTSSLPRDRRTRSAKTFEPPIQSRKAR